MSLLQLKEITKHYTAEPVLSRVTVDIPRGARIGLIGPNGCGKTTLLRVIAGDLDFDRGDRTLQRGIRIGCLAQSFAGDARQTVWDYSRSAMSVVLDLAEQAERLAEQIASTGAGSARDKLAHEYDLIQEQLRHHDGFQLDHQIERVLDGLGFSSHQYRQPIETLSGGQVNRLMLAHLLLASPDLMLFDEPSNHLDVQATEWLEQFLSKSRQAYVVVSHDRFLLDQVTEMTWELLQGTVDVYPGNYSKYLQLKQQRLEVQRRTYERQQAEIANLEDFIRRNHYGQKHAQAEDRRKKLAQIERVEKPREIDSPPMRFAEVDRVGDVVVKVERLEKSFGHLLFKNLSFQIERGQRWGILGPNGCGKTTLIRCLLGAEPSDAGEVKWGAGIRIGYFDQRLECIDGETMAVDAVRTDHKDLTDQQRRDLLARFGIVGDAALQPVFKLSGGQRNRVALARLAATDANVLILDEPTNHLDLWSCEALARAIREFGGTMIVVSHDRYFINQACDHLIVMQPGRVRFIDGNYDTWRMLSAIESPQTPPSGERPPSEPNRRNANRPKRRFPYRKIHDIESDIHLCEQAIDDLHRQLSDPNVLRDRQRSLQAQQRLEIENQRIEQLYEHWQEASELN